MTGLEWYIFGTLQLIPVIVSGMFARRAYTHERAATHALHRTRVFAAIAIQAVDEAGAPLDIPASWVPQTLDQRKRMPTRMTVDDYGDRIR